MSVNVVVPLWIISSAASRVPTRTISGETVLASAGKMYFSSHSISARSSARPRYSTIGAWPCVLTSPGSTILPVASMTCFEENALPISSGVPTPTIRSPSMATAPGASTRRPPSIVTTVPPVTTSATFRGSSALLRRYPQRETRNHGNAQHQPPSDALSAHLRNLPSIP